MTQHERGDQAEREVLGAILRDDEALDDVAHLTADDFRLDAHRRIWAVLLDLFQAGKPIDARTAGDALRQRGQIEDIGGVRYLSQLLDLAPTAGNAVYYARIVRNESILRRLVAAGAQIAYEAAHPTGEAEEVLEAAERHILGIGELGSEGQTHEARQIVREALIRIDQRIQSKDRRLSGLSTGFLDLDEWTAGLQPSELIVLAARPGVGKTSLGLSIAAHVAIEEQVPVFFASLEQSRHELLERLLCSRAEVDGHRLRRGCPSKEDLDRIIEASTVIRDAPLHIDDKANQSMLRIAANARRLKRKFDIGLVVVDYLQLIEPENRRDPRHEQVGQISRRLKGLARDLRLPVLALAQLNREVENRAGQRPRLSDLRESGSIEADADTVMLLHRPKEAGDRLDVLIEKQRNGPTGEVALIFSRSCMRFEGQTEMPFTE